MESLSIRFVRYADDIVVFCDTISEACQTLSLIREYLRKKLKLSLNEEKTMIVRPEKLHFLGYAFTKKMRKEYVFTIDEKIKTDMLRKMKRNMDRHFRSSEEWWQRQGAFHRGWINYYKNVDSYELFSFLEQAEQTELLYFADMTCGKEKNLSQIYISALFNCKNYSSLTGWYGSRISAGREESERRLSDMADKYTFWRSGIFYKQKDYLEKVYGSLLDIPFYYMDHYRVGVTNISFGDTPEITGALTDSEMLILGILASGKNMTLPQLKSYLALKGLMYLPEELEETVEHMVKKGLVKKMKLYQKDWLPWGAPKSIYCYQVAFNGYAYVKKACAPLDFDVTHNWEEADRHVLLYFHIATILWNQIILNCLLYSPSFHRFQIETTYEHPECGKIYVPLYIEMSGLKYYFQYIHEVSEDKIHLLMRRWAIYQKTSDQKAVFVVLTNSMRELSAAKNCLKKEALWKDRITADQIRFSVVQSWFLEEAGIMLPYQIVT